jgi:hypothetical protein
MTSPIKDAHKVDSSSFAYVYEENAAIELKNANGLVRCNVYRPKDNGKGKYPVLVTYGPYGKDVHYSVYVKLALLHLGGQVQSVLTLQDSTPNPMPMFLKSTTLPTHRGKRPTRGSGHVTATP